MSAGLLVLCSLCVFPGYASDNAGATSVYIFQPDHSTIAQTGGIAGVHWTYAIAGKFRLTVDPEAGTASFDQADATATDDSPYKRTLDPNEVFNLTALAGKVVDETTIRFEGKVADGSSVLITLTFADGKVTLKGQTTPPPNSADFFVFTLDAAAQRQDAYPVKTTEQLVFVGPESAILQTGGIAGVHWTYRVEGRFRLTVDFDTHTASFSRVDATATDDSPYQRTLDPNEVFNLTGLTGRVVDEATIRFEGKAADGSSVAITLTFADGTVTLKGETTPPPNSADFFVFTLDAVAQRQYAGGTGEPNNPYQIATVEQLGCINAEADTLNVHFLLMNDLDLDPNLPGGCVFDRAVISVFSGSFDGGGHTIRNLAITYSAGHCIGLLGTLGRPGCVKNLELADARVSADTYVGALVGYSAGGTIENCRVTADVQGIGYTGGIAGISIDNALICDCHADIRVLGRWYETGGIAGANSTSTITRCTVMGTVAGSDSAGGVTGRQDWGVVSESSSACSVSGQRWTGGLIGRNTCSEVSECFATGEVSGVTAIGGLVGFSDSEVRDSWAAVSVSGESSVGGLIGDNIYGFVFRSYSRSVVKARTDKGGFVGGQRGTCLYAGCFWDSDVDVLPPAIAGVAGIHAKPSSELKMERTFTQAGWDFVGETANGTKDTWWILEGRDYPRLAWERVLGDDFEDGTAEPLWMVYQPEPELVRLTEVNGRLEVEAVAQTENVDAIYVASGWRLDTTQDFALRVDFHFGKCGTGDGRVTLGVIPSLDPSGMQWAELEAGCFEADPFFLYEVRDRSWVQERTTGRFANDGTLYLSYNPDVDELYFSYTGYGKANAWQTVPGLLKGRWAGEPVYVILSGGSEGMALSAGDAWLDNFVLNAGTLAPDTSAQDDDMTAE